MIDNMEKVERRGDNLSSLESISGKHTIILDIEF